MSSEEGNEKILNRPSSEVMVTNKVSEMPMCSDSMFKSPDSLDPYYNSSWDPIVSLNKSGNFSNPNIVPQGHFADPRLVDVMLPNIANFGSGNFSEMAGCNSSFAPKTGVNNIQKTSVNTVDSQENYRNMESGALGSPSPYGKRKRKNGEKEQQKVLCVNSTCELPKVDEKFERNVGSNSHSKQVKDDSNGAEPSKETYIHVRAKRGQATNSHSLAERIRRERISERMKLLQELVPGCNKITGKAVMLDEIINYVQSLQQQVEFLSMKLATVNPELNIDIDRLLSKDLLHLQGNNTNAFGITPGLSTSSHHFPGYPQGTFNGVTPLFNHLPQHIWNNELQGLLQMGFDPQPSSSSLGPNGLSKMDL